MSLPTYPLGRSGLHITRLGFGSWAVGGGGWAFGWVGSLYVTCLVGTFDLTVSTVTYTNAGHPPGIVAGPYGIRHLDRGGPPAGLLPDAEFDQELLQLHVGDACLLVTDGVTEALEGDAPLERDLEASREGHGAGSAAQLCQTVMARALAGHGPLGAEEWDDDRTVVVVKVSTEQELINDRAIA